MFGGGEVGARRAQVVFVNAEAVLEVAHGGRDEGVEFVFVFRMVKVVEGDEDGAADRPADDEEALDEELRARKV